MILWVSTKIKISRNYWISIAFLGRIKTGICHVLKDMGLGISKLWDVMTSESGT